MILFFDTSVLIPAFQPPHEHHEASNRALAQIGNHAAACAAHSLAEFYSVTTRMQLPHRLEPEQALICIEQIAACCKSIALHPGEYLAEIRRAASSRTPGGQFYDALLLACARKANADRIVTWNTRHFSALAPDLAGRIFSP